MTQEDEQIQQRRANLEALARLGVRPYPHRFERTHSVSDLVGAHAATPAADLEASRVETTIAGRVMVIRSFGKAIFLVLSDGRERIQVYVRKDAVSERDYEIVRLLDFGDHVGVSGHLFRTKTDELTIWANSVEFLAKCHLPLPEKWHGLQDVEIRYRQRYLDLIVNEDTRRVFEVRSRLLAAVRRFLDDRGYLEVETPVMQPIAGGAMARPFVTHHNALDMDLYLRIAPELYLKRLTVGGMDRVYEIARNFRNEGVSTQHNPEFTMLEFYQAYSDYQDLMLLTEEMLAFVAARATGGTELPYGEATISCARRSAACRSAKARRRPQVHAWVRPSQPTTCATAGGLRSIAARLDIHVDPGAGPGKSRWRFSKRSAKRTSCSRRSSTISRRRCHRSRSRSPTIPTRSSGSSCTSAASRWPTRSAS